MKQGTAVGRYVLDALVGESESVATWQAHLAGDDGGRGRPVALRVVRADRERDVKRMRTEFEARRMIRDKRHVLDAFEHFEFASAPGERWACLVHEFIPRNTTLRQFVSQGCAGSDAPGALPIPEATDLLRQAVLGLRAVHGAGLVHGAVRPEALFVQMVEHGEWHLVVGDLGTAHNYRPPPPSTDSLNTPSSFITPRYGAPEAFVSDVTPRTDAYCLGFTFYEFLAGRAAFEAQFASELTRTDDPRRNDGWRAWHMDKSLRARPLREVCPECPEDIAALVDGLCRKEAAIRVALDDVLAALSAPGASRQRLRNAMLEFPDTEETRHIGAVLDGAPPPKTAVLTPLPDSALVPAPVPAAAPDSAPAPPSAPVSEPLAVTSIRVVPLDPKGKPRTFDMAVRDRIRLGRRPDNDMVFDADDDRVVSGYHAVVAVRHGRVVVRDAGSSNGTWLNGAEVKLEAAAGPADVIRLGLNGPEFRVEAVRGAAAAASPREFVAPATASADGVVRRQRLQTAILLVLVGLIGALIAIEARR